MSGMSNYLENKLIDHLFRGQAYTPPTTLYVGLYLTAPSDASSGVEVSGGNYVRMPISSSLASWAGTQAATSNAVSTGTTGTTSNNTQVVFTAPSTDWGTITAFGIFDSATDGDLLFFGQLVHSKIVERGDTVTFPIGTLVVQIDN